jgi:hypothetical protein
LQRRIILTALSRLTEAEESGEIYSLPVTWAQTRREGAIIEQAFSDTV